MITLHKNLLKSITITIVIALGLITVTDLWAEQNTVILLESLKRRNVNELTADLVEEIFIAELSKIPSLHVISKNHWIQADPLQRPSPTFSFQSSVTRIDEKILLQIQAVSLQDGLLRFSHRMLNDASYYALQGGMQKLARKIQAEFPLLAEIQQYGDQKLRIDQGTEAGIREGMCFYGLQQSTLSKVYFRVSVCSHGYSVLEPIKAGVELSSIQSPMRLATLVKLDSDQYPGSEIRLFKNGAWTLVDQKQSYWDINSGMVEIRIEPIDTKLAPRIEKASLNEGEISSLESLFPGLKLKPSRIKLRALAMVADLEVDS